MVDEVRQGHAVRLEPVLRMLPAGRHLALRGEIDDPLGPLRIQQFEQAGHVPIQVQLGVPIARQVRPTFVSKKGMGPFRGSADPDHPVARVVQEEVHKILSGEGVRAEHDDVASVGHVFRSSRATRAFFN